MTPSHTNLATGIPSSKVKYSRLSSTDDGYIDLQFKKSPPGGFPGGAVVENLPANAGDMGSSPGPGGSHMPRSN